VEGKLMKIAERAQKGLKKEKTSLLRIRLRTRKKPVKRGSDAKVNSTNSPETPFWMRLRLAPRATVSGIAVRKKRKQKTGSITDKSPPREKTLTSFGRIKKARGQLKGRLNT